MLRWLPVDAEFGSSAGLTTTAMQWTTDRGAASMDACTGGIGNQHACTLLAPTLSGVNGNLQSA